MNYSQGTVALCLDIIVAHEDPINARESIKREQTERRTIVDIIKEQNGAITVGRLLNSRIAVLVKQYLI